jgi:hypothetical protein
MSAGERMKHRALSRNVSKIKWSKHLTNAPLLALLTSAGSRAAGKINSACSNAFR